MTILLKNKVSLICTLVLSLLFFYSTNLLAQQPSELIAKAVGIYQAGKTDEAIKLLNQAINIAPTYIDAQLVLGQIYLDINQPKKAKNILTKTIGIKKDNPEIIYALGVANFNLKNFKTAVSQLKKVLQLNPKHKTARELLSLSYLNLGVMEYKNNRKKNSIKKFKKAIKADGKNIQAYKNLAITFYEINEKEEAKKVVKKALKIKPNEKMLIKILIQIYVDKNKLHKALKPAEQYYKYYPNDIDGALQLAYLYRYDNQGDKAFPIYEKALQHSPNDFRIYDNYAEFYKYKNMYEKAVEIYKKALNRFADKSSIYMKIAGIYIYAEMYSDARASYRDALITSKNRTGIYIKIAKTFLTEKNKKMAIKILQEGLNEIPYDWILYSQLGKVLEDTLLYEAIGNYKAMSKLRPENPYSYIRLANIYSKIDSNKLAFDNCKKAIDAGTEQPLPYHILAKLQKEKLDTVSSVKNEISSISKSLKIISDLKAVYAKKLQRTGGKLDFNNIEKMESDSKIIELTRNILKQGLENLLSICKPEEIESKIKEWKKTYKKNPYLIEYLGKSYEKENKIDSALSTYKELIKLDPKEKEGHLGMARIMTAKNRFNDAILAYKRALAIDTKDEEIYKNLIYLSRVSEKLNELLENWTLLEKREPQNTILLKNLIKVLKLKNKTNELKKAEEKLQQIIMYKDKNKSESNFEMRIK